jgi:amino acid transporter
MVATGVTPLEVYAYTGTIGTFGYMLAYLLMAVSLPFFLRKRNEANPLSTGLAAVVVAALLYVFYKNVIPVPDYPYNLFPWIFLGLVVLGLVWYAVVRMRNPEVLREVGMMEEEPIAPGTVHGHPREHEQPAAAHPPEG